MSGTRRAIVCAPLLPEFDRESGSRRIYHLIEFFLEIGWHVTFVAENPRGGERYIRDLQQKGVAVYGGPPREMEELIRIGRFDVAVIAFWYLAEAYIPLLRRVSPSTRIVVDTIDLHFMRNARRTFRPDERGAAPGRLDNAFADETVRELNAYAAADAVWTVSPKEATLIADLTNDPSLTYSVPDAEDLTPSTVPFAKRHGILFLGNFRHPPNVEGLEFLCNRVLPRVDERILREHPLLVVGNALDDRVRRIVGNRPGIRLVGWVPNVNPYIERARITVIPVLHGAGTKRKLLQALMMGTPAVSTTIGAEGLAVRHDEHILIADEPAAFASAMKRLVDDRKLWTRLATSASRLITANHGKESARAQFRSAIETLLSRTSSRVADVAVAIDPRATYLTLVSEVREAIASTVPEGATVAIVSKGDDAIVSLESHSGWHFPRTSEGVYAGEYPADATIAIDQLEGLRSAGAEYLVFPQTAFWWLEYYGGLREYLEAHYPVVLRDEERCVIFKLMSPAQERKSPGLTMRRRDAIAAAVPKANGMRRGLRAVDVA